MITRQRFGPLIAAAAAIAALSACSNGAAVEPRPSATRTAPAPSLGQPEVVTTGLEAPWSIAFHGETPLLSERDSARILELDRDGNAREVAVIAGVTPSGEGGLLGIAVHDGRLYTYFTAAGENRIERFEITGRPGSLALGPAETILDGLPSATFHNGGRIAFGPDDQLYVTVGDAGQRDEAQNLDSPAGKILRLTPEGDVPPDNPRPGSPVYSYGHRNPQGIAWAEDGTMIASEFGQNTWDELNVIRPGGNYGWPEVEGIGGDDRFIDPVQQWGTAEASPSGIAIVDETIFIANLRGRVLRAVPVDDLSTSTTHFAGEYGRLRDVTRAPDGDLWMITNNTDGRGDPGPDDDRLLAIDLPD
jgi:glucose/arabinose dehydrogenase